MEVLEAATNELETMTLQAAQHVIDNKLYARLAIPEVAVPLIESSWEAEPPSLYGRLDMAYDSMNPPKLLEYNADTPTSLLEAAVMQWYWLQDCFPKRDQFNSLHERLVALWKDLAKYLPGRRIDFCSMDDAEDGMTVTYLLDTAQQAGLEASIFPIDEIGWDGSTFLGPDERPLGRCSSSTVGMDNTRGVRKARGEGIRSWIEPPWKMLLSNKGILPILWELFPRHPYLLESKFDGPGLMMAWAKKPMLGREGATFCFIAGEGRGDGQRVRQTSAHLPADGGVEELRREVSGDRELVDRT